MSPSLTTLAATLLLASVHADFGPAFSTGPVGSNSWIREATSTLVLPQVPANNKGDASLWVGMGTSNGDLIQSITQTYQQPNWNVFAYTLFGATGSNPRPVRAPGSTAKAGDKITSHYKYNDATGNYTQIVSRNGQQVSTISTRDGHALGWGSAVECSGNNCGTVSAHSWINTVIKLDRADPRYDQTLSKGRGVTGQMKTSDGGVTWTVSDIQIPAFTFGR